MTDIAKAVFELQAERNQLRDRNRVLEQQISHLNGRLEQLNDTNTRLQTTIAQRDVVLALYEAGRRTNGQEPLGPQPQAQLPPPSVRPTQPITTPAGELDEMPAFLRRKNENDRRENAA